MDNPTITKKKHVSGGVFEMVSVALPMVVSNACDTVMTVTDRYFLGKINSLQMNAALGSGLAVFMLMSFFLGLTGYSTALVAQYLGGNQKKNCGVVVTQSIFIVFLAYPIILLLSPLVSSLFFSSGITAEQLSYQKIYFNILVYGVIINLLRNCFSCFFCGISRTKIVMFSAITAMIVNVIVNYILIYGRFGFPRLEIKGAAYGTIIGSFSGLLMLIICYYSKNIRQEFKLKKAFLFNKKIMLKLLHFGYPAGLEFFFNMIAFTLMIMIFYSAGPEAATATTIIFNWDMVSFVPLIGIEIGVTSLVGKYMGAGKPEIASKATISGIKLGSIYSGIVLIFFIFFTENLVEVFRPETAVTIYENSKDKAIFMLKFASIYVFVEALIVSFIGTLRGAGDTFWSMCLTIGLHWLIIVFQYIFLKQFHFSIEKTWMIVVFTFLLFTFCIYLRYRSGKWKNIKVIDSSELKAEIQNEGVI